MLFVFDDHGGGVAHREAASDTVALEVGVLPQVGVATLIAGLGICIYDACVDKCFAELDQAICPVEGGALILLHGKPRGNAVDGQERWACP